ncbi:hypothetical protein M2375_001034 [Comamonas sp. BIGb0152]|nr:hypothetical protein [Comamonas sp. BIGb0152]
MELDFLIILKYDESFIFIAALTASGKLPAATTPSTDLMN